MMNNFKKLILIFPTLLFMAFSCKKPTVSGVIECDPGYHVSPDSTICLLDTTSHTFVWEIDSIGGYDSYLNDVAIVSENDIWVVGNIRMPDPDSTNGTGYQNYNAAHWNGDEWELMQLSYGQPLEGIFIFNENDIWVASGVPCHWDGQEWTNYHLWDMGVLGQNDGGVPHIWGSSPNNIYFVGRSGSIVHYDGVNFVKMESGTDVDLKDIAGTPDGEYVFAVGYDETYPSPSVVLELTNGTWNTLYYTEDYLPVNNNYGWVTSVHTVYDTLYCASKAGLWKYNYLTGSSVLVPTNVCRFYGIDIRRIMGDNLNDMFFIGSGMINVHFNGSTWFRHSQIYEMYDQISLNGADYKNNMMLMVGFINSYQHAIIAKGFR